MFPSVALRKAYVALAEKSSKWGDLEYLKILHPAATTMESRVEAALERLLAEGKVPEFDAVRCLTEPAEVIAWPQVEIQQPDLMACDQLIA